MLAVIDEATPFVGSGVCYGVISGVLLSDSCAARDVVRTMIPEGRHRPFHWSREGPEARSRMLKALIEIGVVARAVVVPCARSRQEAARAVALAATTEQLLDDGCEELIIEARTSAQDGRDQAVLLDVLRAHKRDLTYTWDVKSNELLWLADAIGGAVHEHLTGLRHDWYEQVVGCTGLVLDYRSLPN